MRNQNDVGIQTEQLYPYEFGMIGFNLHENLNPFYNLNQTKGNFFFTFERTTKLPEISKFYTDLFPQTSITKFLNFLVFNYPYRDRINFQPYDLKKFKELREKSSLLDLSQLDSSIPYLIKNSQESQSPLQTNKFSGSIIQT